MKHYVWVTILLTLGFSVQLFSQETPLPNIAINDLVGQGIDQSAANVVSEQLRAEFLKSGKFRIIERSQMQEILKEQGFQQAGCTKDECAVEIGQILGVRYITVGTIGVAGSYTILSVRLLDVQTGTVVAFETMQTKHGIDNLLENGIKEVSSKILTGFFGKTAALPAKADKKSKGLKRFFIVGGLGVAVVGGGVAAVFLLSNSNSNGNQLSTNNVEIDLP
jgi:TolB-like protein